MKIRGKTTGNFITVILISLVCLSSGMVWAGPLVVLRTALGLGDPSVPMSHVEWLRGAIKQDYVLGDRETAEWFDRLIEKSKDGKFIKQEVLDELLEKMMEELGGDHSQKLNKIAIRLAYGSAGLHPEFAKVFIQRLDSRIDSGRFSLGVEASLTTNGVVDVRRIGGIDFRGINILPAKPYFVLTFVSAMKSSTEVVKLMKSGALMSIDGNYAKFSMIDYEAAFLTYMNALDPSNYNKANEVYRVLFSNTDVLDKDFATSRRVGIFSNSYFESSHISANLSGPGMGLVYKVLDDISRGTTAGFTKEAVLKLWDIVSTKGSGLTEDFREAIRANIFVLRRNNNEALIGNPGLRAHPLAHRIGEEKMQFMESFIEAAKESEELHKLFNEINQELIGG